MKAAPGEALDNAVVVTTWKEQAVRHDTGQARQRPKSMSAKELRWSRVRAATPRPHDKFVGTSPSRYRDGGLESGDQGLGIGDSGLGTRDQGLRSQSSFLPLIPDP